MYESIKTSGEISLILETFDKGLKCATSYSFVTFKGYICVPRTGTSN